MGESYSEMVITWVCDGDVFCVLAVCCLENRAVQTNIAVAGSAQPYSATWTINAQPQITIRASSAIADEAQAHCRVCRYALLNLLYHFTVLRHIQHQSCCPDPSTLDLRHLLFLQLATDHPGMRHGAQ